MGVGADLDLTTTSFVVRDESADVNRLADALDVAVTPSDPGFETVDHPATAAYRRGEAKEGVGMGGALHLATRSDTSMATVRDRFVQLADDLAALAGHPVDGGQT
jgi:NaMN:DMB phosphoribosyltransferase